MKRKKILVINPNTSLEMTKDIKETIFKVKSLDIDVEINNPDFGPTSLESYYDYSLASFGCLRLMENIDTEYDGILIACFGDPGLYAMKEKMKGIVLGIAESSIMIANLLGQKFAILAALDKAVALMKDMVQQYGMNDRCATIEALNLNVEIIEKNKEESIRKLIMIGEKALSKGAEVLILGCAGMTGMKDKIEEKLGIPVLDPVECGYRVLEMLVKGEYKISKKGLYMSPPLKNIKNEHLLFLDKK